MAPIIRVVPAKSPSPRRRDSRGSPRKRSFLFLGVLGLLGVSAMGFSLGLSEITGKQIGSSELLASWVCREHEMKEVTTAYQGAYCPSGQMERA
jgi:hypothetical protein